MRRTCPPALKFGDTVGVVCPAGPVSNEVKEAALKGIRDLGFTPKMYPELRSKRHYLAGDDSERAEMLMRAFMDPETAAVWCLRGGYGSIRTGQHLDDSKIARHTKIFIGFSDITALLLRFAMTVPMVTFHGPVLSQLPRLDDLSKWHLVEMLMGNSSSIPLGDDVQVLKAGSVEGVLVGGNLSVLCSLIGTEWLPDLSGSILFIEDVNEPAYRIDRMLEQLRLSGALNGVRALLIGEFGELSSIEMRSMEHLFKEFAEGFGGPIIRGVPVGHGTANVTIPIGVKARVDTELKHVQLLEPVVRK